MADSRVTPRSAAPGSPTTATLCSPPMGRIVQRFERGDPAISLLTRPRDDFVSELSVGDGTFTLQHGPFRSYERRLVIDPDGAATQTIDYTLAVPWFAFLFAWPVRRALRHPTGVQGAAVVGAARSPRRPPGQRARSAGGGVADHRLRQHAVHPDGQLRRRRVRPSTTRPKEWPAPSCAPASSSPCPSCSSPIASDDDG